MYSNNILNFQESMKISNACTKMSGNLLKAPHSLGRLWTDMGLVYHLVEHQQQCQRSLCLPPESKLLLSCFYRASLWLRQFLWGDYRLEVFAPSSLCVWSQMPWRNLQTSVWPLGFLYKFFLWFDRLSESLMLWIGFSENHFDSLKEFFQFVVWCSEVAKQSIINLSH